MSAIARPAIAPLDYTSAPKAVSQRLVSLDFFRGLTIAGMLLVNNAGPGGSYAPLNHASETPAWHGWTPTDLVFPFFLFIMGVALPFSFSKRAATDSRLGLFLHILARGTSLFLLGDMLYALPRIPPPLPAGAHTIFMVRIFVYAFLTLGFILLLYPWKSKRISIILPFIVLAGFIASWWAIHFINARAIADHVITAKQLGGGLLNPDKLRIPGVLQRIGAVYVVAATLALFLRWRGLIVAFVLLTAAYLVLMCCVWYPSIDHPGKMTRHLWAERDNFARWIDVTVFGDHVYGEYPDPEGLVSTLPAVCTAILGILCGFWLRTDRPLADRCAAVLSFGVIGILLGYALSALGVPINKPLWTPSYVFICAGLAMLGLGTFFYLSDVKLIRWPFAPLKWYGMNAIAAFVLAGLTARVTGMIRWANPAKPEETISLASFWSTHAAALGKKITFVGIPSHNGSLVYALSFVLFIGIFMAVMYRLRIFLKV